MAETFNQRLEALARKTIDEAIAHHATNVLEGKLTERQYARTTGLIAGLHEAKGHLAQALVDCSKT